MITAARGLQAPTGNAVRAATVDQEPGIKGKAHYVLRHQGKNPPPQKQ